MNTLIDFCRYYHWLRIPSNRVVQAFSHILALWVAFSFVGSTESSAQGILDSEESIFQRYDLKLTGRLRHLILSEVDGNPGQEVVVVERKGTYPKWDSRLLVYRGDGLRKSPTLWQSIPMPENAIFFDFVSVPEQISKLIIVRPNQVELWSYAEASKKFEKKGEMVLKPRFSPPQPGQIKPFVANPISPNERDLVQFWIPVGLKLWNVKIDKERMELVGEYLFPPRSYYRTSLQSEPLDLPFWTRGSDWTPQLHRGRLGSADMLFFPWMDEVVIQPMWAKIPTRWHSFGQLDEKERDDAQGYVVTRPVDLNGDGQTDFLVNKFKGQTTSFKAETTLFLTDATGKIPKKGLKLQPEGNRAAGAVNVDLNQDGKVDLAVASSHFSVWAAIKALMQGQVLVQFSFYLYDSGKSQGYELDRPDFVREVDFGFDLTDLQIKGLLPTLEGDFNGDGYPDALYARNRKRLSVLIQKPGKADLFPSVPSGTYDVSVPRKFRVGDVTGDGKSDVVLYGSRSSANRKVTVLLNRGIL